MRVCPFDGCDKRIADDLFACRVHWFAMTAAQKAMVWDAYRAYQRGDLSIDDLRDRQQYVIDEAHAAGQTPAGKA